MRFLNLHETLHRLLARSSMDRPSLKLAGLLELTYQQSMPIGNYAARMETSDANLTSWADMLEKIGCVERKNHPTDRRLQCLHITEAGRNTLRNLVRSFRAELDAMAHELGIEGGGE